MWHTCLWKSGIHLNHPIVVDLSGFDGYSRPVKQDQLINPLHRSAMSKRQKEREPNTVINPTKGNADYLLLWQLQLQYDSHPLSRKPTYFRLEKHGEIWYFLVGQVRPNNNTTRITSNRVQMRCDCVNWALTVINTVHPHVRSQSWSETAELSRTAPTSLVCIGESYFECCRAAASHRSDPKTIPLY